jgi:hypothetical protein
MEVEVLLPSPDGMWSDHFVERIEISETTEIAVAPTPLASWDELEGTWEFGLAVACDDGPCQ